MKILLIGGAGSLTNQLIRKMKKEGHRVYLFTGSRYSADSYEKVFARYDLPYDSDCLGDVFESVDPDVTLFMGAYDSNFRWMNEQQELVRFTSSLSNFLTAYSMASKKRFIYLSSEEVYSENYEADLPEDTPTSPAGLKGMALAQGEDICASFGKNTGAEVIVLRLDHLYLTPRDIREVNDSCSRMCLEAMKNGSISVNSNDYFSLLYISDAVEFIYRVIKRKSKSCRFSVYNISSSKEVSGLEIAQYIKQAMEKTADIAIEEKEMVKYRLVLSNKRFDNEFGMNMFVDNQATVEKVVKFMTTHRNLFLSGEQQKQSLFRRLMNTAGWMIKALFNYLENLVCFFLFSWLNGMTVGSLYFERLDFYLLYVLLFAVVYGQHQATFSAILSVIGYCYLQMNTLNSASFMLDYNTYIWIAQLFIVGLVVGYLKDQIQKLRMESEEEQQFINRQLYDIRDINSSNVRVKDALETQIVNQSDSIGKIYRITSKLEQYMPEEVLFYATEILEEFIGSNDVAVYTVSNDYYARLFTFTSERAKVLGRSLRYRELEEVYATLAEGKVYINRNLDERYPMMANAIFDDDQKMQIIIMIWGIPWERMTLGQADLLTVVGYLIQNAVLRAARYITMLENRRYQEGKYVMEPEAFASLVCVFLGAKEKHLTDCVVLQVLLSEENYEEAGKVITEKIRDDDYIGMLEDGKMYLLLSNTGNEDAQFVINRIQSVGYDCILLEDFRL